MYFNFCISDNIVEGNLEKEKSIEMGCKDEHGLSFCRQTGERRASWQVCQLVGFKAEPKPKQPKLIGLVWFINTLVWSSGQRYGIELNSVPSVVYRTELKWVGKQHGCVLVVTLMVSKQNPSAVVKKDGMCSLYNFWCRGRGFAISGRTLICSLKLCFCFVLFF